jgi:Fe-S-cluster-containing hydrogenase component 2
MNKKDEKAVVNVADCIGCGLCIMECAPGAISLVAKKQDDIIPPPPSWLEMWRAIAEEKKKTYFYTQ